MNLVILTSATDKSASAVISATNRIPVAELDELVLGNQEPLSISFCDDTGTSPAWVTDPDTILTVGLGKTDLSAGRLYSATDDFSIVGTVREGVLNLDTIALRNALAGLCSGPGTKAGSWLTLEISKNDSAGAIETFALLNVLVLWRVLDSPATISDPRYSAVLYDAQTGLLIRPVTIPVFSGGVPRGGSLGQVLGKVSDDDFDLAWVDQTGGGGGGTVTSVGLTLPDIFSVTGSPVTAAGTLSATLVAQPANRIFAGPATGSNAAPTFRSLVAADFPDLSAVYQPRSTILTDLSALSDSGGWLHNDGTGALVWSTPSKTDIGLGNVENTALSTWAGSTSLTTLGTITTGIWQGTDIADAHIASAAAWNAKEDGITAGTTSQYWRGDKSFQTLNKAAVGLGNVENTALSTWAGSTALTTLGTITTGIWQGTDIADAHIASAAAWNAKEDGITAGTTSQYWRGDKSFQTLNKAAVGLGNVENTALSTWAGSSALTTLGTITTGAFNGTVGATTPNTVEGTRISSGALTNFDSGVKLGVNANSGAIVAGSATTIVHFAGADSTNPRIYLDAFGGIPVFQARRANGSNASKSAIQSGDILGAFAGGGYKATAYQSGASGQLFFSAAENWTDSAVGTNAQILLIPKLSTSQTTAYVFSSEGVFSALAITLTAALTTGAPTGGTAAAAKHGIYHASAPSATGYIEEERGGVLYKLLCST